MSGADPLAGALSDRTRSPRGRRRPWLLAGAFTLPICFLLLFHVPDLATPFARWLWVLVVFVVGATAYSVYQVPYVAMLPDTMHAGEERSAVAQPPSALVGIRVAGSLVPAAFIFASILPLRAYDVEP